MNIEKPLNDRIWNVFDKHMHTIVPLIEDPKTQAPRFYLHTYFKLYINMYIEELVDFIDPNIDIIKKYF